MARLAEPKDFPYLKEAWSVCFHDSPAFVDWNFRRNFSLTDTVVAEAEGRPVSNLQLMPHQIRLRGTVYPVNYVSGVATLPAFRRRGLVRELFAFAFPQMARRGEPISLLVPFSYPFYEKFGYKQCYQRIRRWTDALPQGERAGAAALNAGLIARLDGIYMEAMKGRTGYVLRTEETWRRILEDLLCISKGFVQFSRDSAGQEGYALIAPAEGEGGWDLHEVCGPCGIPCQAEAQPFAMARILDPVRVLSDLARDFSGAVRLNIVDENLPQNNLTLRVAEGRVVPCKGYDLKLDIRYLAQLVFGVGGDPTGTGLFSPARPYLNMIF